MKSVLHAMVYSKGKLSCVLKRWVIMQLVQSVREYGKRRMCTTLVKYADKTLCYLANRKTFSGPRKGRNPDSYASVLEYLNNFQNKGLPVTRKALISKAKACARNSNTPFKATYGWCEQFMNTATE
jgi:hypothetical protein